MGDFNEIVTNFEKWGGATRKDMQMDKFRETLKTSDLGDLGHVGSKYTWSNSREDGGHTKERLDCVLANNDWYAAFREKEVQVLAARSSDHKPLLL